MNGLQYVSGDIKTSAIYAKVPIGKEFAKLCQIKAYSVVYEGSKPPTVTILEKPFGTQVAYWQYMDKNFCSTNQIDPLKCRSLYSAYHLEK